MRMLTICDSILTSSSMARKAAVLFVAFLGIILILYVFLYKKSKSEDLQQLVVLQHDPYNLPVQELRLRGGYKILQNYIVARKK